MDLLRGDFKQSEFGRIIVLRWPECVLEPTEGTMDQPPPNELVTLILDKLSDALDEKQKQNKLRNLLNAMSTRDKTLGKSGGLHKGRWTLKLSESAFI